MDSDTRKETSNVEAQPPTSQPTRIRRNTKKSLIAMGLILLVIVVGGLIILIIFLFDPEFAKKLFKDTAQTGINNSLDIATNSEK